jgi:hypothetical protein
VNQTLGVHLVTTSFAGVDATTHRDRILGRGGAMITVLLVVVVLMLLGALPAWPHSRQWGYYPRGGLGLVVLVLVVLMLAGRL